MLSNALEKLPSRNLMHQVSQTRLTKQHRHHACCGSTVGLHFQLGGHVLLPRFATKQMLLENYSLLFTCGCVTGDECPM
jgi:hypothetical protein